MLGAGLDLQGVWPFLLWWRLQEGGGLEKQGGLGGRRGASQLILQRGPLSPSDVLLQAVPAVNVLSVQPCAVWCIFFFFSLTVNKRCDRTESSFSSLS